MTGTVDEPEQQRGALEIMRAEAIRISEISQTLLALSELDAGAVSLQRMPVDVGAIADTLRGRFGIVAVEAGITLEIALAVEPRPLGDPDRLLQAVTAPVDNALAHTPAGGTVRVSSSSRDGMWRLAVDDSGPGIPAERREEVFRRFARIDSSRSQRSGGAGLGLAICRRLVELMGGRVAAEASDLGGARVWIELPVAG